MSDELQQPREFWNRTADDWQIQVGTAGDRNRRFNSDPVLWDFVLPSVRRKFYPSF